jgi:hypothetical protein
MKFTRKARTLIAAAALTSAAIALPAVALAAPGASGSAGAAAAARCPRGYLTAWLGIPGGQTAGSTYYQLEISNVSGHTCTLYGFPGVSAVTASGGQLGSAASRNHDYPELTVTLKPGQTAHVLLQITDVGNYPPASCHPATAAAVRVYAPNDFDSIVVPFSFRACAKRGPVFLHVSPTIAGTGIPGYSV